MYEISSPGVTRKGSEGTLRRNIKTDRGYLCTFAFSYSKKRILNINKIINSDSWEKKNWK